MLTNPYLMAIAVPLILIFCNAVAKKLVRGSRWQRADFFMGVELSLAAMASGLTNFFDLTKPALASGIAISAQKTAETAVFVALCFFFLFLILALHQDWEQRSQSPIGQIIWLGIIANFISAGLMIFFVIYVKGI